jgi:hypothetical protein
MYSAASPLVFDLGVLRRTILRVQNGWSCKFQVSLDCDIGWRMLKQESGERGGLESGIRSCRIH